MSEFPVVKNGRAHSNRWLQEGSISIDNSGRVTIQTAQSVQKRKVSGRRRGMWMADMEDSFDRAAEKTPEVQISHPVWK